MEDVEKSIDNIINELVRSHGLKKDLKKPNYFMDTIDSKYRIKVDNKKIVVQIMNNRLAIISYPK